jgi:hypothetical protein
VATFRGRWLGADGCRRFRDAKDGDDMLEFFPRNTARTLTSVALETGLDPFLRAKARPGEAVPIPEKNLEVRFDLRRARTAAGQEVFQPVFTLRLTKLAPAAPWPGPPPAP